MPRVDCDVTKVNDAPRPDGKVGEGACAVCRRCGHKAYASRLACNEKGAGYVNLGIAATKREAIYVLGQTCPRRPKELHKYVEAVVPLHHTIVFEHQGKRLPLWAYGRTVYSLAGPVAKKDDEVPTKILVIPASGNITKITEAFVVKLNRWGYLAKACEK